MSTLDAVRKTAWTTNLIDGVLIEDRVGGQRVGVLETSHDGRH